MMLTGWFPPMCPECRSGKCRNCIGWTLDVDDAGFRMLEPHEIQQGMGFAADYLILGSKRDKVKQAGNAVTPPAARDLGLAVAEFLNRTAVTA